MAIPAARPMLLPRPRHEFDCEQCGYGAIAAAAPERCPMCGRSRWRVRPGGARVAAEDRAEPALALSRG